MSQWNELIDIFGCAWNKDEVPECLADNICIAWPSMMSGIEKAFDGKRSLKALDFGCGGGLFCRKLSEMNFIVTGYDPSAELVEKAKSNVPEGAYITDSILDAEKRGKYDLIASSMVFPFIEDMESVVVDLLEMLKDDGFLIFAVFNPEFIEDNLSDSIFSGFIERRSGFMELEKGVTIPTYSRTSTEYQNLFEQHGYKEVYFDLPIPTQDFLSKYSMPFSTNKPEFIIQGFRR